MKMALGMDRSPAARTVWLQGLKEARKACGLSQAGLGAKVGLPQSHISRIESGAVDVGLSTLLEISRSLGLEPIAVPRILVPAVRALMRSDSRDGSPPPRPAYVLEDERA
ncbi:MAG: helix-turn-helix transcriptional regulator [Gammaproteobacteria bacterium]|nr:helix-turn-helix transcriptional regulator [Gammaproteobacteria bacterium]